MFDRQRVALLAGIVVAVGCGLTSTTPFEASDEPIAVSSLGPSLDAGLVWASAPPMLTVPEAEPPPAPPPQPELRTVAPQPEPKAPKGTILAHGGGPMLASTFEQFAELCGDGTMVLIPTAAYAAEHRSYRRRARKSWLKQGISEVVVLHARDREEADDRLAEPLRRASCAWLSGGVQGRLEDRYVGTPVERELHALLQRGGAVGGDSAGSSILSSVMIHHGNPEPVEGTGLGILPEVIVDQHFLVRDREPRLRTMVARHPDLVGMGIDESTALLIQGDRFRVIGDSVVRRCTAEEGCADLPAGTEGRLSEPPE